MGRDLLKSANDSSQNWKVTSWSRKSLCHTGAQPRALWVWGKEGHEGADLCILMTDSRSCTAETNKTLWNSYLQLKIISKTERSKNNNNTKKKSLAGKQMHNLRTKQMWLQHFRNFVFKRGKENNKNLEV